MVEEGRAMTLRRLAVLSVLGTLSLATVWPAAAAEPQKVFSCPATFQKTPGWEMNDHDCGTDVVPGTAVLIKAHSDDGKRENLYALCCYEGASLLKKAA